MKILNWAAGICTVFFVGEVAWAVAAGGGAAAYAIGHKFAYVNAICVVIIAIWYFVRKNS